MIIENLWSKLNILIPEPKCRTFNDEYDSIEWNDARPLPSSGELQAVTYDPDRIKAIEAAKKVRDDALNALVHDFSDGRIMQTRPKDESNIRNAIEIMEANSIPDIGWIMLDDIKQTVTVAELKTALSAGQLSAMAIWDAYNP